MNPTGTLVCVGPGMILGAHISLRCKQIIQNADIVYMSCHPAVEDWVATFNSNTHSLRYLYEEGKNRRETYKEMRSLILTAVREGKRVVGCFYGHPGVFAQVPHDVVIQAKKEGFAAHMEPGISAEDCLYADMNIDPGRTGCLNYEASQFLFYDKPFDTSAYLILWQVALAGDRSLAKIKSSNTEKQQLIDLLLTQYSADHQVAIYECPFIVVDKPRIDWVALGELSNITLNPISTLVVPPSTQLQRR